MKYILFLLFFAQSAILAAQQQPHSAQELPTISVAAGLSCHLLTAEPVSYMEVSSSRVSLEQVAPRLLRIKVSNSELVEQPEDLPLVLTLTTGSFIVQYRLLITGPRDPATTLRFQVLPEHTQPLKSISSALTPAQIQRLGQTMLLQKPKRAIIGARDGLGVRLNQIYSHKDCIFLDISYYNTSPLVFDIAQHRFILEDKKVLRAANVQRLELQPLLQLDQPAGFKKVYRNIYVLKKLSVARDKVLRIELSEQQISSRKLTLNLGAGTLAKASQF